MPVPWISNNVLQSQKYEYTFKILVDIPLKEDNLNSFQWVK